MSRLARESLWPALVLLAFSGVVELALLRIVYRVGLFIPRDGPFLSAYTAASVAGSFAFDLLSVLALGALALAAAATWRTAPVRAVMLLVLLSVAAVLPVAPRADADPLRALFAAAIAAAALAVVIPALRDAGAPLVDRAALAFVGAVLLAQSVGATPSAPAEGLAVLAAVALMVAALRAGAPHPAAVAATVVLTMAFALAIALQPYLTGILLLWGLGVTLALPLPLYVAGAGALLLAASAEARGVARRPRALAVVLLVVAGVAPQSSAHAVLPVIALFPLVGGVLPAAEAGSLNRALTSRLETRVPESS